MADFLLIHNAAWSEFGHPYRRLRESCRVVAGGCMRIQWKAHHRQHELARGRRNGKSLSIGGMRSSRSSGERASRPLCAPTAHMAAKAGSSIPMRSPRLSFLCGFEKRASRRAGRGRHRARRPPCEGPSRTDTDVRQAKRLSRAFLTPTDTACIHAARPMGMACTAPRSFSRRSSAVSAACSLMKP